MSITNRFVTSYSELYIKSGTIADTFSLSAGAAPSETNIRDFFVSSAAGTAKQCTVTFGATLSGDAAGDIVLDLEGNNADLVTVTLGSGVNTATAVGALAVTALEASPLVASASNSAGVVTVVMNFSAGDVAIKESSNGTGSTVTIVNTTVAFVGAGAGLAGAAVPNVMEIGTLSNEATVIDVPTFGEAFKGKLRGQLDGGQLDAAIYWAPRDSKHLALREYAEDGTAVTVGIRWKPSATAADADTELVIFDSFVSSFGIDTSFDDVAKASTTLVVNGAEHFAAGA